MFNSQNNSQSDENMDGPGSPYAPGSSDEGELASYPAYDAETYPVNKSRLPSRLLFTLLGILAAIYFYPHKRHLLMEFLDASPISNSTSTTLYMHFADEHPLSNPVGTFNDTMEVESQNTNLLSLEKLYPTAFAINIVPPRNLSGMTREQIKQIRRANFAAFAKGVDNYTPYTQIFDGIVDGKPWWGLEGITLYGPGRQAVQGASYRSNSLLNPLVLIWPNVWDVTFPTNDMLSASRVAPHGKIDPQFPYLPAPKSIIVDPVAHDISMHVAVSDYSKKLQPFLGKFLTGQILVQFEGVNARDMGYPFIMLDAKHSTNVTKGVPTQVATRDFEYYHTGGSCGYSDGCNNLSPKIETLSDYFLTKLPAKVQFKLWHKKPGNFTDKADITYAIYFD